MLVLPGLYLDYTKTAELITKTVPSSAKKLKKKSIFPPIFSRFFPDSFSIFFRIFFGFG